jgi:hypothetical protein
MIQIMGKKRKTNRKCKGKPEPDQLVHFTVQTMGCSKSELKN